MTQTVRRFPAAFAVILFALLHANCATLQPGDIPEESQWEEFRPLAIELQADIIQMRLDLLREDASVENSNLVTVDGSYKQAGDLVPHHYLGTLTGGGIFVDINGNVGVDIIRLLGFDQAYAFKMRRTKKGSLDAPEQISRKGRDITINEGNWGSGDIAAKIEDDGYSMQVSRFFSPEKIVFSKNKIEFIPSGFLSNFRSSYIQGDGRMTQGSTSYSIEQRDENTVNLNGSHEIIRDGNKLILNSLGAPILTIVKSGERYAFFRSRSYGSWIEKFPDRIVICDNGSITEYSYEVESRPVKPPRETEKAAEEDQRTSRAKTGRLKIEKRVDRKTRRDASSSLPPN